VIEGATALIVSKNGAGRSPAGVRRYVPPRPRSRTPPATATRSWASGSTGRWAHGWSGTVLHVAHLHRRLPIWAPEGEATTLPTHPATGGSRPW